jgi:hypothetical protein
MPNGSHVELRVGKSDTIWKGTIQVWFSVFREEDLNVKAYDVRWTGAKWWQWLTWPLAGWAKKGTQVVTQQIFLKLGMIYQSSNSFPALTLTAPTEISIKIGCNWPRRFPKLFTPEAQTTTYANWWQKFICIEL